jgi:hypothetical protein
MSMTMMRDFLNKTFTRRGLLKSSGSTLGMLYAIAQATGIPVPVLIQIDKAMALTPVDTKLFIMVQNTDGIRPNDFNMAETAQPPFLDRGWTTAELVAADFGGGKTAMLPPGIGNLAKYANRMTVLVGVDTLSNDHATGSRNATTNAATGMAATSFHTIVGRASSGAFVIPSVGFTGTNAFTDGAGSGGVTPQGFLQSLAAPAGPSAAILARMDQFRDAFHSEIVKTLAPADQKVVERYWESNGSFKQAKLKAQALFTQPAAPNTLLGHMQMAKRIFDAGLSNSFLIDGTGGQGFAFDTHGGNGPQRTLAKTMSDTIAQFLDELAAAEQLDTVNIMVTTAFGRNPTFNGGGGDDHLPGNGHYTLIGPDFNPGAFGKTTNTQATARGVVGHAVHAQTGEVAAEPNPGGAFQQLTPQLVLRAAADAMGVPAGVQDQYFPGVETMDFLKKPGA